MKSTKNLPAWLAGVVALAIALTFVSFGPPPVGPAPAAAASANITLYQDVATIEVDTTQRTATKSDSHYKGWIVNGGTVKVYIHSKAGTVATSDAQAQSIVGIPPGASFPFQQNQVAFTYKTASSTSVLYWFPDLSK